MGLLKEGSTLSWDQSKKHLKKVRHDGVTQFLNLHSKFNKNNYTPLVWGDEQEYMLIDINKTKKRVTLSLIADETRAKLQDGKAGIWHPEYGSHMIESTPLDPYKPTVEGLLDVEKSLVDRRKEAISVLPDNVSIVACSNFPLIGSGNFTTPEKAPGGEISKSLFLPDEIINPHIRFATLTKNIRERRGYKVSIIMPLFMDKNTKKDIGEIISNDGTKIMKRKDMVIHSNQSPCMNTLNISDDDDNTDIISPLIYMDAMGFGMGCCCQQMTFQGANINQARELYDLLLPLTPIMLSVSVSTPILRGLLADTDSRWNLISAGVDDRSFEEKKKFLKSRYDSVSTYIANNDSAGKFSNLDISIDDLTYKRLLDAGIDHYLARHIAHLYIRDPLVLFGNSIDVDDTKTTEHFENVQSTNWQTLRFKPPPDFSGKIGWRVEFRVMETQFSEFQNAAYLVFVNLLTRALLATKGINLYMNISQIDKNMNRAQKRDSVLNEKFFFRKDIFGKDDSVVQMTANEIINGSKNFTGFIPLINKYLDEQKLKDVDRKRLDGYINFVGKRASGEIPTLAREIRNFVANHPKYNQDSVVTEEINYDLFQKLVFERRS